MSLHLSRSSVIRTTTTTQILQFSFLQPTTKITAGDFEADCASYHLTQIDFDLPIPFAVVADPSVANVEVATK